MADFFIKAINDLKVAKGTATDLKFLVNGEEELTKAEFEEKFEGYTVSFLYNKTTATDGDTFDKETGKVTVSDVETFKYAVEVTKGDEKVITATNADFAEVTVVDATKVTQINKIEAQSNGKAWDLDLAVTTADKVTFVAAEYENALGQTNVDEENPLSADAPEVVKVVSNAPTVAYYDNAEGIKVRKDGKVTFTVEFDNGIKVVTPEVEVKVKATQTPTKVVAKDQKVAAGTTTVDFEILDQDGDLVRPATTVYYTVKAEGKEATSATSITPVTGGKGKIEDLDVTAGKNVVTFYADEAAKEELGKVTITAVEVEGAPDAYEIKPALDEDGKEIVLDLNPNKNLGDKNAKTVSLDVEAKKDGVVVPFPAEGVTYAVESSDEKIATAELNEETKQIDVTGVAKGEATITLYTTEGDMKTKVAEHTVTVDNTIEPIKELTFKDGVEAVIIEEDTEDVKQAVADAVKQELKAGEDSMIESVDTVKAQNIVIVTIKEEYGGGEYVLDAVYDFAKLDSAVITAKVDGEEGTDAEKGTEAKPATLTLTFDKAVSLDGDFVLFTKGTEAEDGETAEDVKVTFAAKPVLSKDGTTITVALADGEDAEIAKDAVITKLEGVKAVKGIVVVKNVKVTTTP